MQDDEKHAVDTVGQGSGNSDDSERGIAEPATTTQQNYMFKLDSRLIPILGCTYTILFLDRGNSESS
jgi:hypothetical protein